MAERRQMSKKRFLLDSWSSRFGRSSKKSTITEPSRKSFNLTDESPPAVLFSTATEADLFLEKSEKIPTFDEKLEETKVKQADSNLPKFLAASSLSTSLSDSENDVEQQQQHHGHHFHVVSSNDPLIEKKLFDVNDNLADERLLRSCAIGVGVDECRRKSSVEETVRFQIDEDDVVVRKDRDELFTCKCLK